MTSTQKDILEAVDTAITALGLSNCEEIAVRAEPKDGGDFYPGITISPVEEREFPGTTQRDDIGYGVQITMVVSNDVDPTEEDLFGLWRQRIRKAFIHQRVLTSITSVTTCLIEPGPVYHKTPEHLDISTMIIRVISRETRT